MIFFVRMYQDPVCYENTIQTESMFGGDKHTFPVIWRTKKTVAFDPYEYPIVPAIVKITSGVGKKHIGSPKSLEISWFVSRTLMNLPDSESHPMADPLNFNGEKRMVFPMGYLHHPLWPLSPAK